MRSKIPLSDLLAHRDGELTEPGLSADIEADPDSRAALKSLREVKLALNELPPVDPGPEVWANIEKRLSKRQRAPLRFPLATAATVFLATALGMLWWNPIAEDPTGQAQPLANLVLQSQALESRVRYPVARAQQGNGGLAGYGQWNLSQRAVMLRIADVDQRLSADADLPADEREMLLRQRIELLETLVETQRRQRPTLQTVLY